LDLLEESLLNVLDVQQILDLESENILCELQMYTYERQNKIKKFYIPPSPETSTQKPQKRYSTQTNMVLAQVVSAACFMRFTSENKLRLCFF